METWVLTADRARARLFSLTLDARMVEIKDFVNPEARAPARELEHAPPARIHDRFGESRHAVEARTSPRNKVISRFAATLATYLAQARAERRYQHLILIAPPRFLGALNAALGEHLRKTVALGVAKNLTRSPVERIREVLPRSLFKRRLVAHL